MTKKFSDDHFVAQTLLKGQGSVSSIPTAPSVPGCCWRLPSPGCLQIHRGYFSISWRSWCIVVLLLVHFVSLSLRCEEFILQAPYGFWPKQIPHYQIQCPGFYHYHSEVCEQAHTDSTFKAPPLLTPSESICYGMWPSRGCHPVNSVPVYLRQMEPLPLRVPTP